MRVHLIAFFIAFILVAACVCTAAAQTEKDNRISIRASCAVPHPLGNGALRRSMTGIYYATFSATARPFSGLHVGAVYSNGLYKTAANKLSDVPTALQVNNVGARVGYDHYFSEITFFSASVNAGRSYGKFTGVRCKDPQEVDTKYSAEYFEPELNLYFIVDPNFAIGVNLSSTFISHQFDPYAVCFNQYKGYSDRDLRGNTMSVNFGFGFYYGFWGGRPSAE